MLEIRVPPMTVASEVLVSSSNQERSHLPSQGTAQRMALWLIVVLLMHTDIYESGKYELTKTKKESEMCRTSYDLERMEFFFFFRCILII